MSAPKWRVSLTAVGTPAPQVDKLKLEAQVHEVVRELLKELHSPQAARAVCGSARLDSELGLGSLERVELLLRLEREFGVRLSEQTLAEANTLDEITSALGASLDEQHAGGDRTRSLSAQVVTQGDRRQGAEVTPGDVAVGSALNEPVAAQTWQEVFRFRAQISGEQTHLILWGEEGESERLTFGDLYAGAQSVAVALASRGIRRGDSVALMLPTCREFFLTFAGILLAGAAPVPIYPPIRADRIEEYAKRQAAILRNAEARLLVTFREAALVARLLKPLAGSLRGIVTASVLLEDTGHRAHLDAAANFPPNPSQVSTDALALLQYTSGSTGNPKGVMLTHGNLLANVRAIGEAVGFRADDVGVSWLPLYHDMGLIGAWLTPLYYGLPVAILSPIAFLTRPERWLWALHKHRGTLTAAPNFAYELAARKIADADLEGLDLSSVRAMLNGAEPVSAETLDRFAERFERYGLRRDALMPVYGLAEGSLAVTLPPAGRGPRVDRVTRETFARGGQAMPVGAQDISATGALAFVSSGRPLPRHEVRIVNESGNEVPDRTEGRLWFRGPSCTQGYFHNAEATAALFPAGTDAGWLDSGDRGYRAEGDIFITGRVKDIILKAGRNLYPHEIEKAASQVVGVRKGCVAAFGVPDAASGTEQLVLVAETREREVAAQAAIKAAIVEEVTSAIGLPPDVVELLPPQSIPKTSSGKLRRSQTRERYLAGDLSASAAPPWVQATRLTVSSGARAVAQALARGIRRAAELLYGVYALLVFAMCLLPTWLLVKFTSSRATAARITTRGLRTFLALAFCPVRVLGREYLAGPGPRVLVSNHTSNADVLILMAALGVNYHFVAKQEIASWPIFGTFLRKLGHFSFDRGSSRSRLHQSEQMEEALRQGESVYIFPEGTFTPHEGVRAFQLGAFKAAAYANTPVVPIALRGTRQLLRDGNLLPRWTSITITICAPMQPRRGAESADWKEIVRLRDAARTIIGQHAGEPLL